MKSPADFKSKGFSLLEVLIVGAIVAVLASIGLLVGIDSYQHQLFRSETEIAVSVLQRARSRALANMYQMPHGVRFEGSDYILFRGASYSPSNPTNEAIQMRSSVSVSGLAEVSFAQLTGAPSSAGTITITSSPRTNTITINEEGTILW